METITKAILAQKYNVTTKTFYNWLNRMNFYVEFPEAKNISILTPKQVNFIYEKLDPPEENE